MKANEILQATQSLKVYNDMQDRMHLQRKQADLALEKKLTVQRLEEIELKRIRLNRELNQNGQNVDTYA